MNARLDWLVLFLGTTGGPNPTDQFRITKGLFLLNRIVGHPAATLYRFEPYDFGPIEPGIDRDLNALQLAGLVRVKQQGGSPRKVYELSEKGWSRFEDLMATLPSADAAALRIAKEQATSLDIETLISRLYAEYPEYLVEYGWTEGSIPEGEDGTIMVGVYERAPAPQKTSYIAIDRVSGEVSVKTDLGQHLGLPELRIPEGERAWGPARPVIAGAEHMIELAAEHGPDSPEVAAVGPVFVTAVVQALAARKRYPPSDAAHITDKPKASLAQPETEGVLAGSRP